MLINCQLCRRWPTDLCGLRAVRPPSHQKRSDRSSNVRSRGKKERMNASELLFGAQPITALNVTEARGVFSLRYEPFTQCLQPGGFSARHTARYSRRTTSAPDLGARKCWD